MGKKPKKTHSSINLIKTQKTRWVGLFNKTRVFLNPASVAHNLTKVTLAVHRRHLIVTDSFVKQACILKFTLCFRLISTLTTINVHAFKRFDISKCFLHRMIE